MNLNLKSLLTLVAVLLAIFCFTDQSDAQGFRFGKTLQVGGGQGFQLGAGRTGMQFGGGQGAQVRAGRFGLRFGNGQGSRIGNQNFGTQFGGRQGAQIGGQQQRLAPNSFLNNRRNAAYSTPYPVASNYPQPTGTPQSIALPFQGSQPNFNATFPINQPSLNYDQPINSAIPTSQSNVVQSYSQSPLATPSPSSSLSGTRSTPIPTDIDASTSTVGPAKVPTLNRSTDEVIRIKHSESATEEFKISLNGTDHTIAPGKSVVLETGYDWNLRFSAGGEFGDRVATLRDPGEYEIFSSEDEGWVLIESPTESEAEVPTLDDGDASGTGSDQPEPKSSSLLDADTPEQTEPSLVLKPTVSSTERQQPDEANRSGEEAPAGLEVESPNSELENL